MYKLKTNRKKHSNVKSWWPFWSQISIFTMNDNSSSTAPIVLHHNNQESHFYGWDFPNKAQLIRKREKTIKTYLKERKWKKAWRFFVLSVQWRRKVDETDKNGVMKPKRRVFFKSQVDHEKSHLEALARWNVVLWRFTFFRAIEETDFQMITTDYFFFLMIVGKFCCVLIKEEKFIYVVTIALIMNAWRLIWLDRWIIDNFNILPQTTSKEQGQNSVL